MIRALSRASPASAFWEELLWLPSWVQRSASPKMCMLLWQWASALRGCRARRQPGIQVQILAVIRGHSTGLVGYAPDNRGAPCSSKGGVVSPAPPRPSRQVSPASASARHRAACLPNDLAPERHPKSAHRVCIVRPGAPGKVPWEEPGTVMWEGFRPQDGSWTALGHSQRRTQ